MTNSINVKLEAPILPEGVIINTEISRGNITAGLKELTEVIDYVFEQSDKSRDTTPGERAMGKQLEAIEKAVIAGLPVEVRLDIANRQNT